MQEQVQEQVGGHCTQVHCTHWEEEDGRIEVEEHAEQGGCKVDYKVRVQTPERVGSALSSVSR